MPLLILNAAEWCDPEGIRWELPIPVCSMSLWQLVLEHWIVTGLLQAHPKRTRLNVYWWIYRTNWHGIREFQSNSVFMFELPIPVCSMSLWQLVLEHWIVTGLLQAHPKRTRLNVYWWIYRTNWHGIREFQSNSVFMFEFQSLNSSLCLFFPRADRRLTL